MTKQTKVAIYARVSTDEQKGFIDESCARVGSESDFAVCCFWHPFRMNRCHIDLSVPRTSFVVEPVLSAISHRISRTNWDDVRLFRKVRSWAVFQEVPRRTFCRTAGSDILRRLTAAFQNGPFRILGKRCPHTIDFSIAEAFSDEFEVSALQTLVMGFVPSACQTDAGNPIPQNCFGVRHRRARRHKPTTFGVSDRRGQERERTVCHR